MPAYRKLRIGDTSWWIGRDVLQSLRPESLRPLLDAVLADPERAVLGPSSVARPRMGRKRFYRIAAQHGEGALFVKAFRAPSGPLALLRSLRRSRARREAEIAIEIERRGFAAAVPIAFGEQRHGPRLATSFSIVRELPARDLRSVLLDDATTAAQRTVLMEKFGELQRRLHDAGIDQDDTSPNNFLVDTAERFTLIDFERCRVGRPLGARRWRLLAKLQRHRLGVSRSQRLRFLRSYLGAGSSAAERRDAWERIRAELRKVRRHDARRAAKAAFKTGRELAHDGEQWIARGRESLPTVRFEMAPDEARRIWVLGHQLERLGLPALRPARLDAHGVALVLPSSDAPPPAPELIRRAQRQLESYGRFVRTPDWAPTREDGREGAVLRDLRAFELDF
jgi:tRNA A-37 threonylcarbamoyl transferase component Bud32